jgi:hypothetical protein
MSRFDVKRVRYYKVCQKIKVFSVISVTMFGRYPRNFRKKVAENYVLMHGIFFLFVDENRSSVIMDMLVLEGCLKLLFQLCPDLPE